MTEGMPSQMQASENRFLQKIKGVTMFDKVRNTTIRESQHLIATFLDPTISA